MKGLLLLPLFWMLLSASCVLKQAPADARLCAALIPASDLSPKGGSGANERLSELKKRGFNAIVVQASEEAKDSDLDRWSELVSREELGFYLWIDVGRNRKTADLHPEWIAGMGSHEDWRLRFPDAPRPKPGERIGVYPWVPLWYRAAAEDRCAAIVNLLKGHTKDLKGVFLNDVQGAPSACGCGNDQCRWTVDYRMAGGPEKIEGSPPAHGISLLRKDLPDVEWIPVWVIECEEHDHGEGSTGYCASVDCFHGLCWKESSKQLEALTSVVKGPLALLAAARLFRRDLPRYPGGWLAESLKDLSTIPERNGHPPVNAERILAIIEGEDKSAEEEKALVREAYATGVSGVIVAKMRLDETWEPRIIPVVKSPAPGPRGPGQPGPEGNHGHDRR